MFTVMLFIPFAVLYFITQQWFQFQSLFPNFSPAFTNHSLMTRYSLLKSNGQYLGRRRLLFGVNRFTRKSVILPLCKGYIYSSNMQQIYVSAQTFYRHTCQSQQTQKGERKLVISTKNITKDNEKQFKNTVEKETFSSVSLYESRAQDYQKC